jgi:hypothetical protein
MRQIFAAIFTLLLTAAIALALDPQTKAEIDDLITYVQTSGVRFMRNGSEYSGTEGAQHLRDKLAKAAGHVKTTDDFITGMASKSYLSGKLYLVKFPGWSHSAYRRMVAGTPRRYAEEQTVNGCYDVEKWRPFAVNVFEGWPRRERRDLGEIR